MKVAIWCRHPHQKEWAERIAQGLKRQGIQVGDSEMKGADFGVTWGVRNRLPFHAHPHVLVMERAYLGDRFRWLSMGWDGLNGKANFCNQDVPSDRWERFWRPLPESRGNGVLIIGQVAGDMATAGVDLNAWAQKVAQGLDRSGVAWRYRAHPEAIKRNQKQPFPSDNRPLDDAIASCDRVITYNSNVGVLAAMAGKRVTVENDGAMAYEVAGKGWQADQPLGDRDEWGRKLAYCQWLPEELSSGEFWPTLKRVF